MLAVTQWDQGIAPRRSLGVSLTLHSNSEGKMTSTVSGLKWGMVYRVKITQG